MLEENHMSASARTMVNEMSFETHSRIEIPCGEYSVILGAHRELIGILLLSSMMQGMTGIDWYFTTGC